MTNELRQIIIARLEPLKTTYGITEIGFRQVQDDTLYPHIVLDFTTVTPMDMGRVDYYLDVHIWTKDNAVAFDVMDAVRDKLAFWNAPAAVTNQENLPTFYEQSAGTIEDPDKTVMHLVLRYVVQTYDYEVTDAIILGKE